MALPSTSIRSGAILGQRLERGFGIRTSVSPYAVLQTLAPTRLISSSLNGQRIMSFGPAMANTNLYQSSIETPIRGIGHLAGSSKVAYLLTCIGCGSRTASRITAHSSPTPGSKGLPVRFTLHARVDDKKILTKRYRLWQGTSRSQRVKLVTFWVPSHCMKLHCPEETTLQILRFECSRQC
jgi:hypothetical protein